MPASTAIQQSLSILLPTHSQKIPATLIHLSESLLAQSRQRASHLKPEEEIARAYACCEIACKRLRAQCRLPAVKGDGAPCKPSVYKKLVTFLERVLDGESTKTTPQTTPSRKGVKRTADGALKGVPVVEDEPATPSKTPGRSAFVGKVRANERKSTDLAGDDKEAPGLTMPAIRKLCKTFSTPLLAPHVYTGACVVLKLDGLWPPDEDNAAPDADILKENVTGLLIALYLMTLTRMQTAKMTASVYKATCGKSVEVLEFKPGTTGVEAWIRKINREGYCREQEWWASVPESVFDFDPDSGGGSNAVGSDPFDLEHDDDGDRILSSRRRRNATDSTGVARAGDLADDLDDPEDVLLPGLATMMHDGVDFLSAERTHEFELWKKQFLKRLDCAGKSPVGGARARKPTAASATVMVK